MEQKPVKRIAIIGTAPTWRDAPWDDPTIEFWCLNDFHLLNPPRADVWFDLHPLDKMFFRGAGKKIQGHDVPAGFFLRPAGHLEWLRKQQIPVYVQDAAALGSPSARTFPREAIVKRFGPNFASSPAWMVALAMMEGATEIYIYGIHLATEWEYQKQKPNLTFLMGIAAGLGIALHLPKGCPLLAESHQYGYEVDPEVPKVAAQRRLQALEAQKAATVKHAPKRRWYQRKDANTASRLSWLDAQIVDAKLGVQHIIAGQTPAGL